MKTILQASRFFNLQKGRVSFQPRKEFLWCGQGLAIRSRYSFLFILTAVLVMLGLSGFSLSASAMSTQVGRFLAVQDSASQSQANPLSQSFVETIPATIHTVGGAMNFILGNSGYEIVPAQYQSIGTRILLNQRLPASDRKIGPITVIQAMKALSGNTYKVVIDPQYRYIGFVVMPRFSKLYQPIIKRT